MDCLPVTLVVKAPNQQIEDQAIECRYDWTVKRVKQQISSVYPSKPKENEQRLIYSGKLLKDDALLKDILKKYDDDQTSHTLHLVCSHMQESIIKKGNENHSPVSTDNVNSTYQNLSSPSTSNDGVRHRVPQSIPEMPSTAEINSNIPSYWNYSSYSPMMPTSPIGIQSPGYQNYDVYYAQYAAWMQQMYSQQMAQYMQIYHSNAIGANLNQLPTVPNPGDTLLNRQPIVENNPNNVVVGNDAPVRMNAQGGAMIDDDNENNRDWLDRLYTFSRFAVLLSIVYFYSSFNRFLFVSSITMVLYLYHIWWQRLRRHENQVIRNRREQQHQNDNNPVQNDAQDENTSTENTNVPPQPEAPRPPSALRICWTFISSFFISLFPQQPIRANEN